MLTARVFGTALLLVVLASQVSCNQPVGTTDGMTASGADSANVPSERHGLEGSAAPDIEAVLLDKSRFNLKQQAANHSVVMLDFWATWCGPCLTELPILMKLAEEYRSKGVGLYAVNLEDDPQLIDAFLKRNGWTLNVVLDPDGSFGRAYGVEGIPFLALIGSDGIVRGVHSGYAEGMEQGLRQELDAILAESAASTKNQEESPK